MNQVYQVLDTLQSGSSLYSTVRLVRWKGDIAVLKDYHHCYPFFRWTIAPLMTLLERIAYRRLEQIKGIPSLLGTPGWDGILIEYIPGKICTQAGPEDFSNSFFSEAVQLLENTRNQGVLHLDVAVNLIIGDDGHPYLIDFTSSLTLPTRLSAVQRYLTRVRKKYDERAVLKLKRRRAPHLLTPEELVQSKQKFPREEWFRFFERLLRKTIAKMGHSKRKRG